MLYYYLCAIFTLISATVSFGFSVQAYISSKPQKGAALINAKYAMARSFSLFLAAIGSLVFVSTPYLTVVAGIMIGVQLFDGIIGVKISAFKTIGPLLTAIGNTIFLVLFLVNAL